MSWGFKACCCNGKLWFVVSECNSQCVHRKFWEECVSPHNPLLGMIIHQIFNQTSKYRLKIFDLSALQSRNALLISNLFQTKQLFNKIAGMGVCRETHSCLIAICNTGSIFLYIVFFHPKYCRTTFKKLNSVPCPQF